MSEDRYRERRFFSETKTSLDDIQCPPLFLFFNIKKNEKKVPISFCKFVQHTFLKVNLDRTDGILQKTCIENKRKKVQQYMHFISRKSE